MTETELNILECFDNNIGNNLDLTKNYIYVLKFIIIQIILKLNK